MIHRAGGPGEAVVGLSTLGRGMAGFSREGGTAMRFAWLSLACTLLMPTWGYGQATCNLDWTLEETLRIGSWDGEDALTYVQELAIGPDGEVYVPQAFLGSVLVFSPNGTLIRSFGRFGSGPGDFQDGPRSVTWVKDTLWVADRLRAQSFDPDGRARDFVSFQEIDWNEGSIYRPDAPLADGTFWARRAVTPVGDDRVPTLAIRRFSTEGATIDTVAIVDARNSRIITRREGGGGFADHPIWGMLPGALGGLKQLLASDRSSLALLGEVRERPGSGSFDLLRISLEGDTLLRRSISYEPRRITREEEEWWFQEFGTYLAGDNRQGQRRFLQRSDAERNRMRELAREIFWLPEYYPPVRRIMAGADETIWLLREFDVLEAVDRWEVYSFDGELIGRVTNRGRDRFVPWLPRLRVLRASRDALWTTTTDEFDVSYIHRFRIDRGCG